MLELIAGLLTAAVVGLTVYCLIDSAQAPRPRVRALPIWAWRAIVLVPILGGLAWLAYGRPRAGHRLDTPGPGTPRRRPARWSSPTRAGHAAAGSLPMNWQAWPIEALDPVELLPRVVGPEDDPDFIADLAHRVEQLRRDRGLD